MTSKRIKKPYPTVRTLPPGFGQQFSSTSSQPTLEQIRAQSLSPSPQVATSRHTEIAILLDRSGSMISTKADMEGGFAQFLNDQQVQPGTCRLTLYQFDDRFETVYTGQPIQAIKRLVLVPRGSTALYESLNRAVNDFRARLAYIGMEGAPRPNVIFVIITDGEENSSNPEYTREGVRVLLNNVQRDSGWNVVYLGANQDAFRVGYTLGINAASTSGYHAGPIGIGNTYRHMSQQVSQCRATGQSIAFSDDQRRDMMSGT